MSEEYEIEAYVQTLHGGDKRIMVNLFKTTKVKVKSYVIPIKPEDFISHD